MLTAFGAGALVPLAAATTQGQDVSTTGQDGRRKTHPIVLSTYSLWRFRNDAFRDFGKCIDLADEFGFDGVELLLYQLDL